MARKFLDRIISTIVLSSYGRRFASQNDTKRADIVLISLSKNVRIGWVVPEIVLYSLLALVGSHPMNFQAIMAKSDVGP